MNPLTRYSLLQVPGILLLSGLLVVGVTSGWLRPASGVTIMVFWLLKDVLLYPLYRPALRGPAPTGARALIGARAMTVTSIQARGFVRVRGERWQARSENGESIAAGSPVTIVAAEGLRLTVRFIE